MSPAPDWTTVTAIALGGALGAWTRFGLARLAGRIPTGRGLGVEPALATLSANLVACFLLGALLALPASASPGSLASRGVLAAFALTGLCGSLSTFSTLCGDTVRLARFGSRRIAGAYALAHLAGGPLALAAGAGLLPL